MCPSKWLLSWIGVEMGRFHPMIEGSTLKPSYSQLGTCQGRNSLTLDYQTPLQEQCFQMCLASLSVLFMILNSTFSMKYSETRRRLCIWLEVDWDSRSESVSHTTLEPHNLKEEKTKGNCKGKSLIESLKAHKKLWGRGRVLLETLWVNSSFTPLYHV